MENKHYYNLDKLIKIILVDKTESEYYKYYPKTKKWFGLKTEREGIYKIEYSAFTGKIRYKEFFCTTNNIPKEYLFLNAIIYNKPYVHLSFPNDNYKTKRFDSYDEANSYANFIKSKSGCINLDFINPLQLL